MKRTTVMTWLWVLGMICPAQVRLKDIASVDGVRPNLLSGFGLVVGLNGTGDKDQTRFTTQALSNALAKSGMSVDPTQIKVKNVAFVMLQSELPPFSRSGSRIDVTVSSYGDATSLQGGTLLWSELKGVDGKTYAIAQGPVSIGGFVAGQGGGQETKNHPTVGRIPNGAMVEREVALEFGTRDAIRFVLEQQDFTTMDRAVSAINADLGSAFARPLDSRTMEIVVPPEYGRRPVELVSRLENVRLRPDAPARVVVNERTGTIVIGKDVRIDRVAIAHGSLTISIQARDRVVQPNALAGGETAVERDVYTTAMEQDARIMVADEGVSLGTIAETLNALKVTPRDLIAILQALKEAGALYAEIKLI